MEGVLLNLFGGNDGSLLMLHHSCPQASLSDLDNWLAFLQENALDQSTVHGYGVGAHDYIRFCLIHDLLLNSTPLTLAQYIAYTSQFIALGPHYLSGVCHYLCDLSPEFDSIRAHPLVKSTICGSRKVHVDPVHRKLCTSHLQTFLQVALHSQSYDDLLFITIFDWWKFIKHDTLFFLGNRAQYHLPYHKGDPFFQGSDILLTPNVL